MTLAEFTNWALSQGSVAKTDGNFKGECVSLINQYCSKVLGFEAGSWGDAYQWANNPKVLEHFTRVNSVQEGDVIVYPANWAGSKQGHIGVADQGHILEQNGHVSRKVSLSKLESGYYAILRSKSAPAQGVDMVDDATALALAYYVYGFNGLNGKPNAFDDGAGTAATLKQFAPLIGQPTNTIFQQMRDDQYGQEFKNNVLIPALQGKAPAKTTVLKPGDYTVV